ncbi:hypothetical protein [Kutzneria kofuensis]|uniref:Uncharacterized protein n=1 Tax=Kutzneria kofuensis TaxID=103725 RepID=A0A7W9KEB5_9PSEU|nr:hypothetical protein [Kutzneria kofuensis]MBB5890890.1 hypothetical protein [Kutzneria kofuensis]
MARLAALIAALLLALAVPASAHDADSHTPPDRVGDLRSALIAATQTPPGVEFRVLQNGEALWLRNSTRTDVVVLDPDGAQRYQVGPDGAAVNAALPAEPTPSGDISEDPEKPSADAAKAPQWQRISAEPVVQWHDHYAHWGDATLPSQVLADPESVHLIRAWQVDLVSDGKTYHVLGELRWIPGPSPAPWILVTLSLAIATSLLGLVRRSQRPLAAATAVLVAAGAVHGIATILGRQAENPWTVLQHEYLPIVLAWLVGTAAVALLATGRSTGRWFAALAAVGLGALALLQDLAVWWSSTSIVALPIDLDRALVSITAGVAVGILITVLRTPNITRSDAVTATQRNDPARVDRVLPRGR